MNCGALAEVIEFYVPLKHKLPKPKWGLQPGKLLTFPVKPAKIEVVNGVVVTDTRRFSPELDKQ